MISPSSTILREKSEKQISTSYESLSSRSSTIHYAVNSVDESDRYKLQNRNKFQPHKTHSSLDTSPIHHAPTPTASTLLLQPRQLNPSRPRQIPTLPPIAFSQFRQPIPHIPIASVDRIEDTEWSVIVVEREMVEIVRQGIEGEGGTGCEIR